MLSAQQEVFTQDLSETQRWPWYLLLGAILFTCLSGYSIGLMDVDASQYASMSREMADQGNWLQPTNRYEKYLDKPPLIFWLGGLFISLLGEHDWAYRLPTLLMAVLGAYSTYRLAKLHYAEFTACVAGIMFMGCQALLLTTHDCRTDTNLASAVALCIWQLSAYLRNPNWKFLYGAALGMGLALLAKGPIGAVVPVVAFSIDWALKRQWRNFLRVEWLTVLAIVLLLLAPMTYGLYQQWGWHGIRFYFWTQSFGRITGENEWDNNVDISFLFTNFLWSFLPWTPWLLYALVVKTQELIKFRFRLAPEADGLSLAGFVLPILMLSTSHYQLPHYSYVILSLASVLTASGFEKATSTQLGLKLGNGFFWLLVAVTAVLAYLLLTYVAAEPLEMVLSAIKGILIIAALAIAAYRMGKSVRYRQLLSVMAVYLAANMLLIHVLYPTVLPYQVPSNLVHELKRKGIDLDTYVTFNYESQAADFYAGRAIPNYLTIDKLKAGLEPAHTYYILARESDLYKLDSVGIPYQKLEQYHDFHVSMLTPKFLNKATRLEACTPVWLLKSTTVGLAYNPSSGSGFLAKRPD